MRITKINKNNIKMCAELIYKEKKNYYDYLFKNASFVLEKALSLNIPPFLSENSIVLENEDGEVLGILLYATKEAFRHRYERWFRILGLKVLGTGIKLASVIGQILIDFSTDDVYIISLVGKTPDITAELLYILIRQFEFSRIITDILEEEVEKYKNLGFILSGKPNKIMTRMFRTTRYRTISGIGWDTHPTTKNKKLFLGGVQIPADFGLEGHSDADVIIHSIIDSIVGVSLQKDIGELFPKSVTPKGFSSKKMLLDVLRLVKEKGFFPINVDCVIISGFMLGKFRTQISESLTSILKCPVSLKFKTGNNIYPESEGKCITAFCVTDMISI
ncbi:2-C-methyl-D-erythritol 2,4-cyclodiphosphate synthase [Thermosipho ferrireducens]|uniref:2-C-methyl-D-erythritol 2,4-cyclodiphosphate synthase n=1 Tax=Thermosipho ferrireducens TaxID=2571116 RepID=A0ABX7S773_9BACT|nr:2-C-methyl-D-erythritol 2,4-cyclodiphosphate synthase [Thermosipho ferrireducens]QTA37113.1 2-C-methyl-D-erythritol 2,4-cyclodiphosphate synthase [Thermosipho ferrireducens]